MKARSTPTWTELPWEKTPPVGMSEPIVPTWEPITLPPTKKRYGFLATFQPRTVRQWCLTSAVLALGVISGYFAGPYLIPLF